jgi:hypothetical protein
LFSPSRDARPIGARAIQQYNMAISTRLTNVGRCPYVKRLPMPAGRPSSAIWSSPKCTKTDSYMSCAHYALRVMYLPAEVAWRGSGSIIVRISPDLVRVQVSPPNQRNRADSYIRCALQHTLVVVHLQAEVAWRRPGSVIICTSWDLGQVFNQTNAIE